MARVAAACDTIATRRVASAGSVRPSTYRPRMRLLHTSDWHLGRSFHREDLLAAQALFVDLLVETVALRAGRRGGRVGRRLRPGPALGRRRRAVRRRARAGWPRTGARVVLISGNHDSARRLGFGADLIDAAGVHLRTDPRQRRPAGAARRRRRRGRASTRIPYLEPDAVRAELASCDDARPRGGARRGDGPRPRRPGRARRRARSVVLAHAFVAGGAAERERARHQRRRRALGAAVGCFDGVDYAALGHLHGAQRLADRVRYSGSPLAYSFSEEHHTQGRAARRPRRRPGAAASVEAIPTPVHRPLARVRGRLDDLLTGAALGGASRTTTSRSRSPTRPGRATPMERLRRRFPHALVLALRARGPPATGAPSYAARLRGRDDLEVATDFVAHVRAAAPTEAEAGAAGALPSRPPALAEAGGLMRLHRLDGHRLRPVRRHRAGRLRRAGRRRAVPLPRADRGGQDEHPRRRLLRALRPGPRRARGSRGAAQRPRSRRRAPRGGAGG